MKQFLVLLFIFSIAIPSLDAMNHARQRSYTDSDIDCTFSKVFHRTRIENKLREKAKKARQAREKQQSTQFKSAVLTQQYIKSPRKQLLLSPKRISPSQEAHSKLAELTV
jgi:hypothetical protein